MLSYWESGLETQMHETARSALSFFNYDDNRAHGYTQAICVIQNDFGHCAKFTKSIFKTYHLVSEFKSIQARQPLIKPCI